jgi:hypothetical protein
MLRHCQISYSGGFLKAAKSDRKGSFQKEKKYTPQFGPSTCKKNFSPIGLTVPEKKGENFKNPLKN